ISPWNYSPLTLTKSWSAPNKEIKKISRVYADSPTELPANDHVLALAELFNIGLMNSPSLSKVWQESREAAASYAETLSSYYPNLSFEGYVLSERIGYILGNTFASSTSTAYGPLVLLNYTIWDSGERSAVSETSLQALYYANWTHSQEIQNVLQQISSSFYDYLYEKSLLIALEEDLKEASENYKAALDNFELGIKNVTDVLQAKTQYLQKEIRLISEQTKTQNSYIHLLEVLGIPTDLKLDLPLFPESPPLKNIELSVEELVLLAKDHRPNYLAAKAKVLSNEANVEAQRAQVYPQIDVSGNGGQTWYTDGYSDNGTYSVQLNLSFPIFSGFLYQNQVKQAVALLQSSLSVLKQVELSITSEVRTAYNTFESSKKELLLAEQYLEAAQNEYGAVFARYVQGTLDILDLFSASSSLSDARARLIGAKRDLFMSIINVNFATGTLCEN
ncbi:MAG: TolC family protein, partial [Chlamydiae bacterium]|nr:TolC family protein [Chlamydiota bacterium]